MAVVALTGATGFIGRHTVHRLARDHRVRALVRTPAEDLAALGVETVRGDLDDDAALARLVRGAEVVLHLAGAVHARDRRTFFRVNADGSERLAHAAAAARVSRFVLVSSLAAREPHVSAYAASKAEAEARVLAVGRPFELVIVRPPAIYGPGDRATLDLVRGLARGLLPLPAARRGRFSLLYVEDLAELLVRLVDAPGLDGLVLEPDDGRTGGWGWDELAAVATTVTGRPVRVLPIPRPLAWLLALAGEVAARLRGTAPPLPRDRLGQLYHPDWVCAPQALCHLPDWRPRVDLAEGLRRTLDWYRASGRPQRLFAGEGP